MAVSSGTLVSDVEQRAYPQRRRTPGRHLFPMVLRAIGGDQHPRPVYIRIPPVITRLHRERGRRCTHLERTLFFGSQSASMCILSWYAILSLSRWWARSHNPTTSPSRLCIVVLHRIVEDLKSNSVEISYRCPPPLRSTTVEFNGLSERNVTFIGAVRAS